MTDATVIDGPCMEMVTDAGSPESFAAGVIDVPAARTAVCRWMINADAELAGVADEPCVNSRSAERMAAVLVIPMSGVVELAAAGVLEKTDS